VNYRLLLVNGQGEATTSELRVRTLREFPGLDGLSVHFRPVRNDLLFESAKFGGHLAYRILSGEGIVRSQLWVEYEVLGEHLNVMGRSSDLLFALALITSKWKLSPVKGATVAATGVLDAQGAVLSVERTAEKLAAAVRDLGPAANAIVFYPAADAQGVEAWSAANKIPAHLELRPVANLDDALAQLGYVLEKVYLRNPFRGLEHFDYEHHSIFFGRDGEVREVVKQLLRREAAGVPGLLIEGPSGSGKSSFLRAGVLPALVDPRHQPEEVQAVIRARPVSPGLRGAIWRPGLMPSAADEPAIVRSIQESWAALPEWAADWRASRVETLAKLAATRRTCWPATMRFVWVVDQLEELFTVRLQSGALEALGRFLGQLQNDGAWTLASIRVDAIPQLKQHQALRTVFGANEGQYYLATLKGLALEDVINLPAKAADLTFGIGPDGQRLEQLLREEAYREPDSLPQLQFTLNELYLNRSGNELRYATYQHLGGLSGSIATRAETILKSDTPDSQQTSRRLFRNLVSVDETGRAARRYAPMTELAEDPAQTALVVRLIQARLCVTDERDGQPVVAFSHDSLLRTLPSLIDWLQEEAALLQTRELVQREARLWQQNRRSDAWLAAADKLVAFQALEAAYITLPAEVRDFIDRSRRYARRATRIRQAAMSVIALLALAASIGAWIGLKKEREAEYQTQQTLAAQARLLTDAAAQRLKAADLGAAQGIILEVLRNPLFAVHRTAASIAVFQEARAADPQRAVLGGHGDVARFAAYSPDGTRIVSASYDKTARIWDAHTGAALAVLSGHKDRVFFAAYSPDGTRVVTASADRTARIWNAQTGAQLAVVQGHTGGFNSAVFSPDGTRILTASGDKNAQLWDARTGVLLASISGHSDVVGFARFSPDGTRLVTASNDRTARIWDARTGAQLTMLSGHDSIVYTASYSPDGSRIVTSSSDKTARIWNARTGAQLAVLSGHGGAVYSAAYSPDGTRIVTASFDRTVRIWDSQTSRQLATIAGFGERVCSAMYSPDGDRIVTASFDRTVRIWDAQTGGAQLRVLSGAGDRLNYAAYSPDGTRIVIASNDKTARILDARTGALLAVLSGHRGLVAGASYSPDSARIVTASYDNTARIWDGHTGALLSTLSGHAGQIESAVYSPDGTRIVTPLCQGSCRFLLS